MDIATSQFRIIEYDSKYRESCEDLLVELEEFLITLDKDNLDVLGENYKEKMLEIELKQIVKYSGKCFLATMDGIAVGMIMGIQREYSPDDSLDYLCPKAGVITEFIVTKEYREHTIGKALLKHIEDYFRCIGCTHTFVNIFAYNKIGINFYEREGYHPRMITSIKPLCQFD